MSTPSHLDPIRDHSLCESNYLSLHVLNRDTIINKSLNVVFYVQIVFAIIRHPHNLNSSQNSSFSSLRNIENTGTINLVRIIVQKWKSQRRWCCDVAGKAVACDADIHMSGASSSSCFTFFFLVRFF